MFSGSRIDVSCYPFCEAICICYAAQRRLRCAMSVQLEEPRESSPMKIGKPLIVITTVIGVIGRVHEAYRLAGGLVFLMVALLLMISAAIGMVVATVRREKASS